MATDLVAGAHHQRIKLEWGADGTVNEVDDVLGKRVPVVDPSTAGIKTSVDALAATITAGRVQTDVGTVALPTGASTAARQDTGNTSLASIDTKVGSATPAGTNLIGKVGLDQTTPGTTESVTVATGQGAGATVGVTTGAAVVTDANGTLQQYLRGLVKLLITTGTIVLGAGSAAIGKLAANAGVIIGDVNVTDSATRDNGKIDIAGFDVNPQVSNLPATVDTNSGVKSASTLRVVLATDQPALTNKLLVTPDSVALPANQSTNVAQVAGTTTDTNSGNKSAGTIRVVIATDQPALTNKLLVTPDSVALPANQSCNVAQINGVTPLMGAGNTGTGSHRVTIASDQAVIPVGGNVANAATDSGNPTKIGGVGHTANPTAVTDGQRVDAMFDKLGKQVVVAAVRDLKSQQKTTITSSTAETTIITAVASTFLDLYGLIISNTSATACAVTIKDSTSGTTRAIIYVPAGDTRGFMLPADSGLNQATVNNNWTATCSASVASIEITAMFVKNI